MSGEWGGGVTCPSQAATIFGESPKKGEVWYYPDGKQHVSCSQILGVFLELLLLFRPITSSTFQNQLTGYLAEAHRIEFFSNPARYTA